MAKSYERPPQHSAFEPTAYLPGPQACTEPSGGFKELGKLQVERRELLFSELRGDVRLEDGELRELYWHGNVPHLCCFRKEQHLFFFRGLGNESVFLPYSVYSNLQRCEARGLLASVP